MQPNLLYILTFAPLAAGAVGAMIADGFAHPRFAAAIASLGLLAGGFVGLWGGWAQASETVFGVALSGRAFSTVPGVIALLGGVVLASTVRSPEISGIRGSRAALVTFAAFGAGVAASAIDLTTVVLSLELAAVCSYALVSQGSDRRSSEAAFKYFIQGSVATGLLVAGLAIAVGLYAPSGGYPQLREAVDALAALQLSPALAACVLLVAAFAFKAGAVPFHSWAPDAYETAPPESAAFLASGVKIAAVAALALFVTVFAPLGASPGLALGRLGGDLLPMVGVLGVLSVLVGSVAALRQTSYTRMLGYAGVAQVGYALIAVAALNPSSALVFICTYAIGSAGAFLGAAAFRQCRPAWDGTISGLAGLGKSSPLVSVSVSLLLVSLAGIPPLVGFWGKFEAFGAAIYAAQGFATQSVSNAAILYATLATAGIIGSIVSVAYYGSVLRALFFDSAPEGDDSPGGSFSAAVVVLALIALALGIAPLVVGLTVAIQGFLLN